MKAFLNGLAIAMISLVAAVAYGRTWTTKSGRSIDADLVKVSGGVAWLAAADEEVVKIPLKELSDADRAFVAKSPAASKAALKQAKPKARPPSKTAKPATDEPAEPAAESGDVRLLMYSLEVKKPGKTQVAKAETTDLELDTNPAGSPGTILLWTIASSRGKVLKLVEDPKISSCRDDRGTDLLAQGFNASLDDEVFGLQFRAVPKRGAQTIHLQGSLKVVTARDEKVVEQQDVPLEERAQVTVAGVPLRFTRVDRRATETEKMEVILTGEKSIKSLREVRILNADGKDITSRSFNDGFQVILGITEELERCTVRITEYGEINELTVPLDLKIGVGF